MVFGFKLPAALRARTVQLFELHPEVRRMRRHLSRRVGRHDVLEVGCGFGVNAALCQGPYLGIDPDREAIEQARRRLPGRRFGDTTELEPGHHTLLLSLVLHETEQRRELLQQLARLEPRRLLIYDFDPRLRGLARLRVNLLEEQAIHSYWGFDAELLLRPLGYTLAEGGALGPRIRWWEFLPTNSRPGASPGVHGCGT